MRTQPTLETFIEDVAQTLRFEDLQDIILVGHSFAGSIVSALADRMPERLRRIVYLDAMVLESGQAPEDITPPGLIAGYKARATNVGGCLTVSPNAPAHYGITDPAQADWLREKLTPMPLQVYYARLMLKNPLGNGIPATFIACTDQERPATAHSQEMAKTRPGWTYLEIPTGHNAMMLWTEGLIDLLSNLEQQDRIA